MTINIHAVRQKIQDALELIHVGDFETAFDTLEEFGPVLCDEVERLAQRIAVLEADAGNDLEYKRITKAEVDRLMAQNEELRKTNMELRDKIYAWTGDGPAPAKWTAPDGTLVYRSYEDYCDD